MLEIRERVEHAHGDLSLTLPFEARQRSRQRVLLSDGKEAALVLARGSVLRGGDVLRLSDGRTVTVRAAVESVSTVHSDDAWLLVRAAYHLGNRHVPLQVGRGFVRYLHDHVLDAMVRELGLSVRVEESAFEPEAGAYGQGHAHGHDHSHDPVPVPVNDHHVHDHSPDHHHSHSHSQERSEHEHVRDVGHGHGHGHGQKQGRER